MGGLSLVLCILQCAPWPWQKAVTHQSTLYRKSLLLCFFYPSPSCNSRWRKIMQSCSCLDHSSKEDESSSAKTWFLSTTGHPRIQLEPFFTLVLLITLHLSNSPLHSSSWDLAAIWVPLSKVTEKLLGPWSQGTLGFRSVTTQVPQCLPISRLMNSKDFRVMTQTGDTLLKNTPLSIIWGRKDQVHGVLGLLSYWLWFYRKNVTFIEKLREKRTLCHSSSDTSSEKSLLVVRCLSAPLTKLFLLRPVTQY